MFFSFKNLISKIVSQASFSLKKLITNVDQHPFVVSAVLFSGVTGSFGFADYTKTIGDVNVKYSQRESTNLLPALLELHASGYERQLEYHNIAFHRNRCDELHFLYQTVEKKIEEAEVDEVMMKLKRTRRELEVVIVNDLSLFTQKLCRRAMLRNGYYLTWFQSMAQDEFVKYFILPIGLFLFGRQLKMFDKKSPPVQSAGI